MGPEERERHRDEEKSPQAIEGEDTRRGGGIKMERNFLSLRDSLEWKSGSSF